MNEPANTTPATVQGAETLARICPICDCEFEPTAPNKRYCSLACKGESTNRRKVDRRRSGVRPESSCDAECDRDRRELIETMWRRYFCLDSSAEHAKYFSTRNANSRVLYLRHWLTNPPDGWWWGSVLEAAALGLDDGESLLRLKSPEKSKPTATLPGTPERAEVYAARVRAGLDLWHKDDATYDFVPSIREEGNYAVSNL
jgi:hypothetical protein